MFNLTENLYLVVLKMDYDVVESSSQQILSFMVLNFDYFHC